MADMQLTFRKLLEPPHEVAVVPSSFRLENEAALSLCGVVAPTFFPTMACRRCDDFQFGKTSRRGLSSSTSYGSIV